MSKYVAILQNKKPEPMPEGLLESHVAHLKQLRRKGILFLCGPLRGSGSLMQIFDASSYQEAEDCLRQDPYISENYFTEYTFYELVEADEGNNYLMDGARKKPV